MATNPYFQNKGYKPTQNLFDELSEESIKINGIDVVYIVKTTDKVDNLFGDNQLGKLKNSFSIEMYLKNARGFEGQREIVSKFGMEIKDNITLIVSKKRFREESFKLPEIGGRLYPMNRPIEGDLIYLPLAPTNDNLFEIKFVENDDQMFQQGDYYTFRIDCELYKYSMEDIQTGFSKIDDMQDEFVQKVDANGDGNIDYVMDKKELNNNSQLQSQGDDIIDFTERDPFSEGNY
jgi:hypothetical protein